MPKGPALVAALLSLGSPACGSSKPDELQGVPPQPVPPQAIEIDAAPIDKAPIDAPALIDAVIDAPPPIDAPIDAPPKAKPPPQLRRAPQPQRPQRPPQNDASSKKLLDPPVLPLEEQASTEPALVDPFDRRRK